MINYNKASILIFLGASHRRHREYCRLCSVLTSVWGHTTLAQSHMGTLNQRRQETGVELLILADVDRKMTDRLKMTGVDGMVGWKRVGLSLGCCGDFLIVVYC